MKVYQDTTRVPPGAGMRGARPVPVLGGLPRRDALAAAGLGITSVVLPSASSAASLTYSPSSAALSGTWTPISAGGLGLGVATNATSVFLRNQVGTTIRRLTYAGASIASHSIVGADASNILSSDPAALARGKNDLAHSSGFLFIRSSPTNTSGDGGSRLFAMRISDDATWPLLTVAVPESHPLPVGKSYVESNLFDLPDGRIGCVEAPTGVGSNWSSLVRIYSVGVSGDTITVAHDEDITLTDIEAFPLDCHGMASDGRFLHRLDWRNTPTPGYRFRVWNLETGDVNYRPTDYTATENGNVPTWMAHNHVTGQFLIGNYARASGTTDFFTVAP